MNPVDEAGDKSRAVGHHCPNCGSIHVTRSKRRGIQEVVVLKREGLSPYRCRDCDRRFIERSHHPSRPSHGHSLAGRLGILDAKTRRRMMRMAVAAVLTVLALFLAYVLFGYFTRPAPPVDAVRLGIFTWEPPGG